ncbi:MAG: hypothetical protein ACI9EF_000566 [Pseudohongiellaceae bacterium]|jgi:hypothetical protein
MLISLLLSALLLAPLTTVVTPAPAGDDDVFFHVEELVYHPTRDGVVLTLVPAQELHVAVAWGPKEPLEFQSGVRLAQPGRPLNIPLTSVDPGGEILYRVYVREASEPHPLHRVQTLPQRGTKFSFAVAADTHAWAVWSKGTCGGSPPPLQQLEQTLENIAADESLRFLLLGTDIAMTKCGSCSSCDVDGLTVSSGTVSSYADALLRWRRVLQPDLLGMVGADLPLLVALGDHEGEQGWLNGEIPRWSEEARRQHIPLASASYKGGPAGGYYAVESGDLLLVVLDIHRHTTSKPLSVDDWTLGKGQLAWLARTLARSNAQFKIVTAEHLLGGLFDPSVTTQKGRGGITATDDGTSTGTFVGEQAQLHELFMAHGVQVFMSFQDHVAAWGEKLGSDGQGQGVTYLIGGRASGVAPPAAALAWYIDAMDYDGDGVPEFDTEVTGTKQVGYFRVTVEPGQRLLFEYVLTSTTFGGGGNGDVLFSFAVDQDGHPTQVFPLD